MPRASTGWVTPVTDYGPLLAFFITYSFYDLLTATAALMAATAVALGLALAIERRVPMLPLITAAVVGLFGGLTLYFNDETFIKLVPDGGFILVTPEIPNFVWIINQIIQFSPVSSLVNSHSPLIGDIRKHPSDCIRVSENADAVIFDH